jgi:DNA-binding FadR family transcriptional regulator
VTIDFPNVGGPSLRDRVVEALEQRILDGRLPVGDRMPTEIALSEKLGVSRTVVRDALRILEVRGLIDVQRGGRGMIVLPAASDAYAEAVAMLLIRSDLTLGDLMAARAALEGQLLVVAAMNHRASDLRRIRDAMQGFEKTVSSGDGAAAARTHVLFHTELLRATRLKAISILLEPIQQMMLATSLVPRGFDPSQPEGWRLDVHKALVEAVASRDPKAVDAATAAHWRTSRARGYREIWRARVRDYYPMPRDLLLESGLGRGKGRKHKQVKQ